MPGLDVAWVGMNVPALDTGGRPWVWEIVTPSQYESSPRLQEDPLVLAVAQDTVVADINHNDHSGPIMRMQVPVRQAPDAISVMTGLDPTGPWSISSRLAGQCKLLARQPNAGLTAKAREVPVCRPPSPNWPRTSSINCTPPSISSRQPSTGCLHSTLMMQPWSPPFLPRFTRPCSHTARPQAVTP